MVFLGGKNRLKTPSTDYSSLKLGQGYEGGTILILSKITLHYLLQTFRSLDKKPQLCKQIKYEINFIVFGIQNGRIAARRNKTRSIQAGIDLKTDPEITKPDLASWTKFGHNIRRCIKGDAVKTRPAIRERLLAGDI